VVVAILTVIVIGRVRIGTVRGTTAASASDVTIERATQTGPLPGGFIGLSIEIRELESYTGHDPKAVNPLFEQMIRNLAPGQQPSLRIGGDSTDWSWWPIRGMHRPLGVRNTLTPRWMAITHALTQALNAKLILGVNLEVNSRRVAGAEAQAYSKNIGLKSIQGFEVGNEPELYDAFAWFELNGVKYYGRPKGYTFANFMRDYSRVITALPHTPLAGPNIGAPTWMPYLARFLAGQPRVKVATLHRYPLKRCSASAHTTIGALLTESSSRGLADSVATYAAVAHKHHIPLRIDEMNAVSCGGEVGVSDTFASALWSIDALFEMARVGVDGVNFHTRPGSSGELFSFKQAHGSWTGSASPVYYGLSMFAQAAPAGSRLLRVDGAPGDSVRVWATRAPDGHIRVVLINTGVKSARSISLRIPAAGGAATVERLQAPSLHSDRNVTLGNQHYSQTTGTLTGKATTETVSPVSGRYVVQVPAASAALVTLSGS
jgi:glycosyl hydrolase family 79